MPLAAPVTRTVNPVTERLNCLKSDMRFFCHFRCYGSTNQSRSTMNELDFSGKRVLVVGGSSGIGNGIAQAFQSKGAAVHVWGTRASARDYSPDEGSHLEGLEYARLDVSDPSAIENFAPAFER